MDSDESVARRLQEEERQALYGTSGRDPENRGMYYRRRHHDNIGDPEDDGINRAAASCGCFVLFVLILVFALSWDAVTPVEMGITYNKISKSVDGSRLYEPGRYLIGPHRTIKIFPKTYKTISFTNMNGASAQPLTTRTQEGLALTLEVSFQYQLNRDPSALAELYNQFALAYEDTFIKIARESILQGASNFIATEYFTKRKEVGEHFKDLLDKELRKVHTSCIWVQVLKIVLPDSWEDSIESTQVEQQNVKKSQFEQTAAIIRAQTSTLKVSGTANITRINATAQATSIELTRLSELKTFAYKQQLQSSGLEILSNELNFGNNGLDLLNYLRVKAISRHSYDKLVVNLPNSEPENP